ncbi:MAG: hypothetical protein Kow00121_30180 [Elainellaceae cyanobacterium]
MIGAGLTSGFWGYSLGRESLKGVTQPNTRPVNNTDSAQGSNSRREELVFLKEEDILANVKAQIEGGAAPADAVPNP